MADNFDNWIKQPVNLVAAAIAAGWIIVGVGWALSLIIKGILTGIGLATVITAAGVASLPANAGWIVPTATAGIGLAGLSISYLVVFRVSREAKKNTFEWLLPALGVFAAILADLFKDFVFENDKIAGILFAGTTGFLVIISGFLLTKKAIPCKIAGVSIQFIPYIYLFSRIALERSQENIVAAAKRLDIDLTLAGLVLVSSIVFLLGLTSERESEAHAPRDPATTPKK